MDYAALKLELTTDPEGLGYDGTGADNVGDAALFNSLATNRKGQIDSVNSSWIFELIDSTEFQALVADDQARVDRVLGLGEGISTQVGSKARAELVAVFGGGSATITAMQAAITPTVSRAVELGFGRVTEGDVYTAYNMGGIG
jgi:hypothetical protein